MPTARPGWHRCSVPENGQAMKKFTFRLDKVLDYRKHREQTALRDLLQAKNETSRTRAEIDRLGRQRSDVLREGSEAGERGVSVARYQLYEACANGLALDQDAWNTRLKECENRLQTCRQRLQQEMVDRKTLETLKAQKEQRHWADAAKAEQNGLDEMALQPRGTNL